MDDYATKLMNEAININYIDETEYPRIAVMNGKCINIVANLWNSPEKETWKTGALAIGSSEACMLGGVAAWLRWRKKRQAQGKPFDKPNFVISTGFQVVWEKFAQLWQIEMREVPLTLDKTTLDPEEALKMCDENTICIVPIQGVTWTGLNDDVEALDKALDAYNAKTGYDIPIHVDAASGGFILPFLYPEKKWDFRLKWVLSISVIQCKLPRCQYYSSRSELLSSCRTDSGTILPIHPFGIPRLQGSTVQLTDRRQVHPRRNRQDGSVRQLFRRSCESAVHLVPETGICKNSQMDSV